MLAMSISQLVGPLRAETTLYAVERCKDAKLIVETGCYRGHGQADGCSTLVWAWLAKASGGRVISIDVNPQHIEIAREFVGPDAEYVDFVCADSVEALARKSGPIDLLYLDSLDFDVNDPAPSQQHQLREAQAALPHMAQAGVILLDDCAIQHGGKAGLSAPYLEAHGWQLVKDGYQRVYARHS